MTNRPQPSAFTIHALLLLASLAALGATPSAARAETARCLEAAPLTRVGRMVGPDGRAAYVRVIAAESGAPTEVSPIAPDGAPLASVFAQAEQALEVDAPTWRIPTAERATRVCAPAPVSQTALGDETAIIVAAGLNYAAHAEEAGGGNVFLFPKPAAPSAPYGLVAPPEDVVLLDYEVELAYVLLDDVDLEAIPDHETFLERTAFFVTNDITDREALIRRIGLSPPGIGFVEAKGQPNFLPAGPWMVRGSELFAALAECGASGLGIGLEVDEGNGFVERQRSTTDRMIVSAHALLEKIATQIRTEGLRTRMPMERDGEVRYYPFAVQADPNAPPTLPAGTIVLTGTPEGVAMQAPSVLSLAFRGLLRLRSPTEQLRIEQIERARSDEPGGYLAPGDRVRARVDGLGAQEFTIAAPGSPIQRDPCRPTAEGSPRR
jgi:2-keto-4-pentenoate hydratase/2-oxohepta-3-ene-1,7-dioic acid hydratase in catechol pathway